MTRFILNRSDFLINGATMGRGQHPSIWHRKRIHHGLSIAWLQDWVNLHLEFKTFFAKLRYLFHNVFQWILVCRCKCTHLPLWHKRPCFHMGSFYSWQTLQNKKEKIVNSIIDVGYVIRIWHTRYICRSLAMLHLPDTNGRTSRNVNLQLRNIVLYRSGLVSIQIIHKWRNGAAIK